MPIFLMRNIETDKSEEEIKNRGKLILDASCSRADIAFPTDLGLLNKGRIQTERIIDKLHEREGIGSRSIM
jgi:hypothetical protein